MCAVPAHAIGAVMSVEPVVIWLVIAVIAAIGEVVTFDLFMACIAVAAVLAGSIAFATPAFLQLIVFAGASAAGIVGVRPTVKRMLGIESLATAPSTLASHISGRRAVVSRDVDGQGGQIRIGQGEFWTARSFDPADTFPAGTQVDVMLVDGLTALVERAPSAPEQGIVPVTLNLRMKGGNS